MPQASKYAENTELQKTEIDAAGIKIRGKHGITEDRERCRRHQNLWPQNETEPVNNGQFLHCGNRKAS
jgi:hypothetical protein